ncbi:basic salivary proline-rich protein 3-like [Hemicordylus capensis]|uniref:basic salivary proline-rich protein 3-like n=1 Tax=Hemicordylus capensis TaxID=884348 RepID=UPI00230363F7|nr:basic salivary proline-rich protein 3-like [Hemicordylus capensis]
MAHVTDDNEKSQVSSQPPPPRPQILIKGAFPSRRLHCSSSHPPGNTALSCNRAIKSPVRRTFSHDASVADAQQGSQGVSHPNATRADPAQQRRRFCRERGEEEEEEEGEPLAGGNCGGGGWPSVSSHGGTRLAGWGGGLEAGGRGRLSCSCAASGHGKGGEPPPRIGRPAGVTPDWQRRRRDPGQALGSGASRPERPSQTEEAAAEAHNRPAARSTSLAGDEAAPPRAGGPRGAPLPGPAWQAPAPPSGRGEQKHNPAPRPLRTCRVRPSPSPPPPPAASGPPGRLQGPRPLKLVGKPWRPRGTDWALLKAQEAEGRRPRTPK